MQVNLFGSDLHHQIKGELDLIDKDWNIPPEYPDLTGYKDVAVDLETYDPNIKTLGPGWARNDGHIIGVAVAAGEYKGYFPIRHENAHNLDPKFTLKWLKKQMACAEHERDHAQCNLRCRMDESRGHRNKRQDH